MALLRLERPVDEKGFLPDEIRKHLGAAAKIFEKDFFDITREEEIDHYIVRLNRRQAIVAGCETDVCVLQSCLGLLDRGHEVYVVEDLLFFCRTTRCRRPAYDGTAGLIQRWRLPRPVRRTQCRHPGEWTDHSHRRKYWLQPGQS
jgi:hypothetical protein